MQVYADLTISIFLSLIITSVLSFTAETPEQALSILEWPADLLFDDTNSKLASDIQDDLFQAALDDAVGHILGQQEQDEADLSRLAGNFKDERTKRFTVDFNGKQVSYPTYVRLTRLQDKVLRLKRMIQMLHMKYTEEQLENLPQYQKLMKLYTSLKPLLPTLEGDRKYELDFIDENEVLPFEDLPTEGGLGGDEEDEEKRSPFMMDFMGMTVTYPQYNRLIRLQSKVR